jgi:hypothetical protein
VLLSCRDVLINGTEAKLVGNSGKLAETTLKNDEVSLKRLKNQ